jgi:hypothetical protein
VSGLRFPRKSSTGLRATLPPHPAGVRVESRRHNPYLVSATTRWDPLREVTCTSFVGAGRRVSRNGVTRFGTTRVLVTIQLTAASFWRRRKRSGYPVSPRKNSIPGCGITINQSPAASLPSDRADLGTSSPTARHGSLALDVARDPSALFLPIGDDEDAFREDEESEAYGVPSLYTLTASPRFRLNPKPSSNRSPF